LLLYQRAKATIDSYVQIFRDGSIEACDSSWLRNIDLQLRGRTVYAIPVDLLEGNVINFVTRALAFWQEFHISPPIAIFLTFTHIRDHVIPQPHWRVESTPIDRNMLFFSPEIITDWNVAADKVVQPIFDALWNASGYPRDLLYDEDGRWRGNERAQGQT